MPAHKNQHFVPRCALKPFSLDCAGHAINLYNIGSKRSIENVPVKGQCARDYLYAKEDLRPEQLLMKLEGNYSRVVALLSGRGAFAANDLGWLQIFILVQMRRTEMAIEQMRNFTSSMADATFASVPDQRPVDDRTDAEVMRQSMAYAIQWLSYMEDLKVIIFSNATNIDFVTSDNPAVMTNRFQLQKLKSRNFGLKSSGAILSMPLTPRLSALCYDAGVYSVPNASGTPFVEIATEDDVYAVNQLQYLSAGKNIYFSRWDDAQRVGSQLERLSDRRAGAGHITNVYIRDDTARGPNTIHHRDPKTGKIDSRFRKGGPNEEISAKNKIILTSFQYPEPDCWPSKLTFRHKPKTFEIGSAVGHVRKLEWL